MADLVLFPNCDLHVALHGTPALRIRVASRDLDPGDASHKKYLLQDRTANCRFDLFAPYAAVGARLQAFVTINPATGIVTPTGVGTNLVQISVDGMFIIARIQVHDTIQDWWFGNSSITTAKDNDFAHAQPSIYALFSDDATGTELVGDITGHGFVTLTSSAAGVFTVNGDGRLQGVAEGDGTLSGTFLAKTNTLPVRVVDYGKARATLQYVHTPNVEHVEAMHNVLFIAEGFRDTQDDRDKFEKIVTKVVDELFSKPRHTPYGLLQGSFNVWKAYEPSREHCLTCGFRINDEPTGGVFNALDRGYPIPYTGHVDSGFFANPEKKETYTVEELVRIVGLPSRKEIGSTTDLKNRWASQSLKRFDPGTGTWVDKFNPARVDDDLVDAWKVQKSAGILESRDTFFGLYIGGRNGDRLSRVGPVPPPANDAAADANLAPFISRMYEWFITETSRTLSPDPRRHPPELQAGNIENLGNSILNYINNLRCPFVPHPNVGPEWVPDPTGTVFKKSRGLVALICNDGLLGGTNFNALTITANTLSSGRQVSFAYSGTGNQKIMKRTPPDSISEDIDDIINTVAHEFGHSFNLGDEYEDFSGDQPDLSDRYDNVSPLSAINLNANYLNNRQIDPAKVKWFDLLRIDMSDALLQDSETDGGRLKLTIEKQSIGRWTEAKAKHLEVNVRQVDIAPDARQLPLKFDDNHYLTRLEIEEVDEVNGIVYLGGPELPPLPLPVFRAGSMVFIPKRDSAGNLVYVVEKKALDKLNSTNLALNKDTDTVKVNKDADDPVDIADFKPPCKSYKLIGVYEGASQWTGMVYRPAGLCKMRKSSDVGQGDGEFCHVCKYLIVNRVDPGRHDILDRNYYPTAKKNG